MRRLALLALLLIPTFIASSGADDYRSLVVAFQQPSFATLTVSVEPDDAQVGLGSYQIELVLTHPAGDVLLAGVSGGDGLFSAPPAHPETLHAADGLERIVLADFSTADPEPGAITVARLDVMLPSADTDALDVQAHVIAAGDRRAAPIGASVRTALSTVPNSKQEG